jgi:hypothetical protein
MIEPFFVDGMSGLTTEMAALTNAERRPGANFAGRIAAAVGVMSVVMTDVHVGETRFGCPAVSVREFFWNVELVRRLAQRQVAGLRKDRKIAGDSCPSRDSDIGGQGKAR